MGALVCPQGRPCVLMVGLVWAWVGLTRLASVLLGFGWVGLYTCSCFGHMSIGREQWACVCGRTRAPVRAGVRMSLCPSLYMHASVGLSVGVCVHPSVPPSFNLVAKSGIRWVSRKSGNADIWPPIRFQAVSTDTRWSHQSSHGQDTVPSTSGTPV